MQAKKEARKMWETPGRQEYRDCYRQENKAIKKAVATSKVRGMNVLYDELETQESEINISIR